MPNDARSPALDRLLEAARLAPSADNCQPWRLCPRADGLRVTFDRDRAADGFGPRDPATLLALGVLIENLLAAAAEAGIGLRVLTSPGDGTPPWYLDAQILDDPGATPEAPRTHPLWQRQTNRFAYRPTPLPAALSAEVAALGDAAVRVRVIEAPARRQAIAGLVERGSRLRFRIQAIHEWLAASLRLTPAAVADGDGLDPATLDLPPGGGLLLRLIADWRRMRWLNRLGLHRLLAAVDSAPLQQAPAIIAVTAADTPEAALAAGRRLALVWYRLHQAGIAVQPYYVLTDLDQRLRNDQVPAALLDEAQDLRADTTAALGLEAHTRLYMLLRVGEPTRAAPRSRRLPLERLLSASAPA